MPTDELLYIEVHGPLGLKVLPRSLLASTKPGPEQVVVTDDKGDVFLPGNVTIGGLLNGSPPGSGGTGTPIPNNTLVGNNTGAPAIPTALTAAQVKVLLGLVPADVAGLAPIASSGSATDLTTGTLDPNRIANTTLPLNKLVTIPNNRLLGNNIGIAGAVISLTPNQVKTLLAIAATEVSGLAPVATSGSATDLLTGTLPPARIGDGSITLLKEAPLPAQTMVGNDTLAAAGPTALTPAQVKALLGISGSGFPAIAPNTIVGNNTGASVPPVALTAAQVKALLAITAADTTGFAPIATSGSASDLPVGTLPPARIGDSSVALTKLAAVAAQVLLGNATGAPAGPIGLTPAQVKTLLAIATGDVSGLQAIASSGSGNDLITGIIPPARIGDASVTTAKLAPIAGPTLLGNNGGAPAVPLQLTPAQVKALLGITAVDITDANTWMQSFLVTPTSSSLRNAVDDETGVGPLVFGVGCALNGPVFAGGSATAQSWPRIAAGTLLTTPEAGAIEYESGGTGSAFYMSPAAGKRGLLPTVYMRRLSSDRVLANSTSYQNIFSTPATVALDQGLYEYELVVYVTGMGGSTNNAKLKLLAASGTIEGPHITMGLDAAGGSPANAGGSWDPATIPPETSGNNAVPGTATAEMAAVMKGTMRVTAAGSLTPQISLTVGVAAATVKAYTFFKVTLLGPVGGTAIGPWS